MLAACEKNLPIIVPGWEDATLAHVAAGGHSWRREKFTRPHRHEYMTLARAYTTHGQMLKNREGSLGFFQIGGGIAGDFPICVVPMLHQDLELTKVPLWGYSARSGLDHELRQLFRAVPTRRSPGASSAIDAEIHHRKRRDHRAPAGVLRGCSGSEEASC